MPDRLDGASKEGDRMRVLYLAVSMIVFAPTLLAADASMSREAWVGQMRTALPVAFCQPQAYFRMCFDISAQGCEETASSAVRVCLKDMLDSIPATLVQPADGQKWGTKLGECAGIAFDIALDAKKNHSPKCDDPSAWQ